MQLSESQTSCKIGKKETEKNREKEIERKRGKCREIEFMGASKCPRGYRIGRERQRKKKTRRRTGGEGEKRKRGRGGGNPL